MYFANDATSKRGVIWTPKTCVVLPQVEKENNFAAYQEAYQRAQNHGNLTASQSFEQTEENMCDVMHTPDRGSLLPFRENVAKQGEQVEPIQTSKVVCSTIGNGFDTYL